MPRELDLDENMITALDSIYRQFAKFKLERWQIALNINGYFGQVPIMKKMSQKGLTLGA